MKILEYFIQKIFPENRTSVESEYVRLYRACFEGSSEEIERKLENWDWVHRTTRYN